jgi:phosphopantothenoylcysteine decarboxylase/phosphopantothenate--cysteine ligase
VRHVDHGGGDAALEAADLDAQPLADLGGKEVYVNPLTTYYHNLQTANDALKKSGKSPIVIKAAAVADYRPVIKAEQKIKRTGPITIELTPTEDILAEVVRLRKAGTMVIGFAAETENTLENGRVKLLRKGVDAIVLNDVARPGLGFDSDRNAATFLTVQTAIELPEMSKRLLAERILDEILALRRPPSVITETDAHVSRQD